MHIHRSLNERIFGVINIAMLSVFGLIMVYPFVYVVFASVSDATRLSAHQGLLLIPDGLTLNAYAMTFRNPMIPIGYRNTLFYVALGLAVSMTLTILGAYALSRPRLLLKRFLSLFCLFTMFFSGGMIPLYLKVKELQMMNTIWSLLLPGAINTFNLIVMRTSFAALPEALEESAKIDGANDFLILVRIVLPLSMSIIAVIMLFYGVSLWNAWFYAMLFLKDRLLYPLQLILREILITSNQDVMMAGASEGDRDMLSVTIKYATIVIASLPVMCIYPMMQKFFVKGVMIGAVKG